MQLQGKLVFKDAHTRELWTLVTSKGVVYKLPGQPQDSSQWPIPAGSSISLDCTPPATTTSDGVFPNTCVVVTNAKVVKAASFVRSSNLSLKLLVMVVSISGGGCNRAGAQVSAVQQAYVSASGYASFLRNCSYGSVVYNNNAVTVISTPVPCSTSILQCDEDAIAAAAKGVAAKQLGATNVASFTHFSYVLPTGVSACDWVGLAELPGTQTWYSPNEQGIFSKGTVLQESLHNLGIVHGWKNGVEYEDWSTAMGYGNSCPSAPELWRLGWINLLAQLNSSSFPANVFQSFTLPATYLGPDKVAVKIQPDWLGAGYKKNVYLALRVKAGGDQDLLPEFDRKINIHELDKNIDNNFQAAGDPRITILGTVAAGSTTVLPAYKLVVRADGLVASGTKMAVRVCRYQSTSSECKDSGSTSYPPPSPPTPPPPAARPSPQPPSPSPKPSSNPSPNASPSPSPSPNPDPSDEEDGDYAPPPPADDSEYASPPPLDEP